MQLRTARKLGPRPVGRGFVFGGGVWGWGGGVVGPARGVGAVPPGRGRGGSGSRLVE